MNANRIFPLFVLLYLICSFYGLVEVPLGGEEPRRAYLAVEGMTTKDPLIMRHYGHIYYNKPPVHHFFNQQVIRVLGPQALSYRLTSFIAYLLTGFLLYRLILPYSNVWAKYSLLIFMLSPDLMLYQSIYSGEIDGLFAFFLFFQFVLFYKYSRKSQLLLLFMAYLFGAIAFLTKGLPGIFITVMGQVSLWFTGERNIRTIVWHPMVALIPAVLLLVSYFLYFERATGQGALYLLNLIKESTGKTVENFNWLAFIEHFIIEFPGQILKFTFPFILIALFRISRKRIAFSLVSRFPLIGFGLVYLLLNIWPYWLSSYSKSRYLIPFIPVLALILGAIFFEMANNSRRQGINQWSKFLPVLVIQIFLPIAALAFIPDLPVYRNYQFVLLTLSIYVLLLMAVISYKDAPSIPERNFHTYAFVLIGIKVLMIYGILSEPLQRERRTRTISAFIYEICKQEKVYMTGELERKELSLQLGPFSWSEIKHKPPLMAYQIPLYYYEKSGTRISYSAKLNGVGCYIKKVSRAQEYFDPGEGYKNHFVDPWTNSVFKIEKKASVSNENY